MQEDAPLKVEAWLIGGHRLREQPAQAHGGCGEGRECPHACGSGRRFDSLGPAACPLTFRANRTRFVPAKCKHLGCKRIATGRWRSETRTRFPCKSLVGSRGFEPRTSSLSGKHHFVARRPVAPGGRQHIWPRQGAPHDCRSQGHSGSVSRRGSANMPHGVACISPACRWIAMHVHHTPAGAASHPWMGSPAAEEPSLAIVRCVRRRRQAHNAANIRPTCLMSRRTSPRLWVDLGARWPAPTGVPHRHSNSVGGTTLVSADWHVRLVLNTRVSKAAWCQFPALNTIEIEDRTGAKASAMALDKALFSV